MAGIKSRLIDFVKGHEWIYTCYFVIGNAFIHVIRPLIRTQNNLILFVSYGGRYYNDSPQVIYEQMINDLRFADYEFVWAFREPRSIDIKGSAKKIKIDTLQYYITAIKARCWVTNVMIERALRLQGKHTYYFHTTHGILMKKGGRDITKGDSFDTKANYQYNCSCAQSEYEAQVQVGMYGLQSDQIILSGYPKNDRLANSDESEQKELKKKLGLPLDKKAILYAPTFREKTNFVMSCPIDMKLWEKTLGDEYVLMYRVHPVVRSATKIPENSTFVFDESGYPDVTELMIASDILISDYSGIIFDYAVLNRPMFCYTYDYDDYVKTRGLYFDIREELLGGSVSEEELLKIIKYTPFEDGMKKVSSLKQKYVTYYGGATQKCIGNIYENICK